ncbi:MAG: hypothetical protein O9324_04705 [Microcystis sp. LE19-84.1B]|uniref:hypothetical protein n=1 Tax=Microcystis sp. LE19-84.1B TaxID=3016438 RepID=UPI0022BC1449|nr:hypothetical protein [Microcystis sp. LE19-84.1B]MCZ8223262.1 hypothetical protein [Microcystis sp. LE19-84.1B]
MSRSERVATSLTYIGSIDLCVLCVFVVCSTPSLGAMYLRIHFTHQIQESQFSFWGTGNSGWSSRNDNLPPP